MCLSLFKGGLDVVVIADASSSIADEANLQRVMDFVKGLFHLLIKDNHVRLGLAIFGKGDLKVIA